MYAIVLVIFIIMMLLHLTVSHVMPSRSGGGACKIIWFFRPGCGYCTRMTSAWDDFVKQAPSEVELLKVNTQENPEMARDFNVDGVPFIVKVTNGKRVVYNGDRSTADLLKFAKA